MAELLEEEEKLVEDALKHLTAYRNIVMLLPSDYQRHNKCHNWAAILRELIANPAANVFERVRYAIEFFWLAFLFTH